MKPSEQTISRRDFFKGALAGAIAMSLASIPHQLEPPFPKPNQRMGHYFKVSNELLNDENGKIWIDELIKEELAKYPDRKMVGEIKIGYDGGSEWTPPDFVLNMQTVIFYTEKA